MDGGILQGIKTGRGFLSKMPNKKAKERKRKKRLLNISLSSMGRTAKQVKRKNKKKGVNNGGRKLYR